MNTINLIKFIFPILLLVHFSCDNEDEKQICNMELQGSYIIHNYKEFSDLNNKLYPGSDFYHSSYEFINPNDTPKIVSWIIQANLKDICNTDIPIIEFSVSFKNIDSTRTVTGIIREDLSKARVILNANTYGKNYYADSDYIFEGTYQGISASLYSFLFVDFKTKGSFSADSAHFFTNLNFLSCTIKAHKPE